MSKTLFVLLLPLLVLFSNLVYSQSGDNVTIKVTVVTKSLELKNVPKFALDLNGPSGDQAISTDANGNASLSLSAGHYSLSSVRPLVFEDKSFSWTKQFDVTAGSAINVELSSDNAAITAAAAVPVGSAPHRRVSEAGELLQDFKGRRCHDRRRTRIGDRIYP